MDGPGSWAGDAFYHLITSIECRRALWKLLLWTFIFLFFFLEIASSFIDSHRKSFIHENHRRANQLHAQPLSTNLLPVGCPANRGKSRLSLMRIISVVAISDTT